MGLKDDGSMANISKCVEGDDGFHVVGELVVAPERALGHVHVQLKRAVDACGNHPVFIVTPWPRFARTPCCSDVGHETNFNNADFLSTILGDLNKHKAALRKALPSATIIDGLELISGAGYNAEKAAAVINSGWAFDPVHPSKHVSSSWRSTCWRRWPLRTWTAARADSVPQTRGRGRGVPATRAAAAVIVASPETDSTAPAARVPAGGRPPEVSNGRREVTGTAPGQLTQAAMPADLTAAARTTADTVTGGRRGAAAVVVSTTATRESLTAATAAAATAAAATAAAEEEDTAAGSKSGFLAGQDVTGSHLYSVSALLGYSSSPFYSFF